MNTARSNASSKALSNVPHTTPHLTNDSRLRSGFTLIEIVIVLAIMSALAAVTVPRIGALLDQLDARSAATDASTVFSAARSVAIARSTWATVDIDTAARTLVLRVGHDTLRQRDLGESYGVHLRATRPSMTYAPSGMGYGAANLTLVLTKRSAADTVTVARLGRVR